MIESLCQNYTDVFLFLKCLIWKLLCLHGLHKHNSVQTLSFQVPHQEKEWPIMCLCIIYSLLFLIVTSISLHISLVSVSKVGPYIYITALAPIFQNKSTNTKKWHCHCHCQSHCSTAISILIWKSGPFNIPRTTEWPAPLLWFLS